MTAIWRIFTHGSVRLALGPPDQGPEELLPESHTIHELLGPNGPNFEDLGSIATIATPSKTVTVLAPIDRQEVWAAGVTYVRSRDGRKEESSHGTHYDDVYAAERPEIFFKSTPERVRGPGDAVGIRFDSTWNVPEPELGVVVSSDGRIVGYVVGNDMSSRSLEGENPLYLPQAKMYTGSCSLGPCIVPVHDAPPVDELQIHLKVCRERTLIYEDLVELANLHRRPEDLVRHLYSALEFPYGAVLLTGTAIVPPPDFTLEVGDVVTVTIPNIGELQNVVECVGGSHER